VLGLGVGEQVTVSLVGMCVIAERFYGGINLLHKQALYQVYLLFKIKISNSVLQLQLQAYTANMKQRKAILGAYMRL